MSKLILAFFLMPLILVAQKKDITLEDLYKKKTFQPDTVPGFSDLPLDSFVNVNDVKDNAGKKIKTKYFAKSKDKKRVVILTGREKIYRRSSKAHAYYFDVATKKSILLNERKIMNVSFSPDGNNIAYVLDNNLYLYNIASATTKPVTTDGKLNFVINGNCDWVYEEEFGFTQAYQWSRNGNYIAYYRFDESRVKEFSYTEYGELYDSAFRYKYPKAGENNSVVDIYIYDLKTGQQIKAQYDQGDIYIPRIKWTQDDHTLCIFWMNRHQNHLKLLLANAKTGTSNLLYEETNKYYIDINDDLRFFEDGRHFLFTSEMKGYRDIYVYSFDGKTKTQIHKGNYDVAEVVGADEKNKMVYYTVAYPRPMDRNLFATDFEGRKTVQLTQGEGWHRVDMSENCTQFYDYFSTIHQPEVMTLHNIVWNKKRGVESKLVRTVNENNKLKTRMQEYELGQAEFIRVPNSKGDTLNGWMLKPTNFDPSKKYPVLFCNYGGPGSQRVRNRFDGGSFWHQMLAQHGFIVVSVDNTGTGFRGEEFKKKTYLQLGKYEIEDQIDAARYLGAKPFVDSNHIGHWGWSFGGFMSSLAITKGADVFSAAVAVAPVTSLRYYDNIYTERYMRTPAENPKGYDDNSPINFTDQIKGKYLLIHGTADDNVHFQNSANMIKMLIRNNIDFESAYYPDKNHSISGENDNTSYHLWRKMSSWILENLGNENTRPLPGTPLKPAKAF